MDNFDLIILKDLQFYQIPEHFLKLFRINLFIM